MVIYNTLNTTYHLNYMVDRLIALLAPHVCLSCGREGGLLCVWCRYDAIDRVPQRCYRCYRLSPDNKTCAGCRKATALEYVWVRSHYAGLAHDLVYSLKFSRAKAAAGLIANLLDEALPYLPADTIVTYVPTATNRVRLRGYDQTRLIAKELARLRRLPCRRLLIRLGQTRQVRSSRAQRATHAADSYVCTSDVSQVGAVLLVDDIVTTGATLEFAAKALKQRGIKHVYGAVFAQKQ